MKMMWGRMREAVRPKHVIFADATMFAIQGRLVMRSIAAVALVIIVTACSQAQTPSGRWLIPAEGPPLGASAVIQLSGKTCWGFFDKGNNSETARGAVFIRFSQLPPVGDFWLKLGKVAQVSALRDSPEGYDYMGKTTVLRLTPAGTEMTFTRGVVFRSGGQNISFDWFIRPTDPGNYTLRSVNSSDTSRGAVGELHCS